MGKSNTLLRLFFFMYLRLKLGPVSVGLFLSESSGMSCTFRQQPIETHATSTANILRRRMLYAVATSWLANGSDKNQSSNPYYLRSRSHPVFHPLCIVAERKRAQIAIINSSFPCMRLAPDSKRTNQWPVSSHREIIEAACHLSLMKNKVTGPK